MNGKFLSLPKTAAALVLVAALVLSVGCSKSSDTQAVSEIAPPPETNAADLLVSPLGPLLNPRPKDYSIEQLRELLTGWLSLDRLGPPDYIEFRVRKLSEPDALPDIFLHLIPATFKSGETPVSVCRLGSAWGEVYALILEPIESPIGDRICIFQHGHKNLPGFWRDYSSVILQVRDSGQRVILPLQPHMAFDDDEFLVFHKLHLLGLSLMGLRVAQTRLLLTWLLTENPKAQITFMGHSGGSMIGYYTSAVDPRIEAVALDHLTCPDQLLKDRIHCESVAGLYYLKAKERTDCRLRTDILQAGRYFRDSYDFPDRQALARWLIEPQ